MMMMMMVMVVVVVAMIIVRAFILQSPYPAYLSQGLMILTFTDVPKATFVMIAPLNISKSKSKGHFKLQSIDNLG